MIQYPYDFRNYTDGAKFAFERHFRRAVMHGLLFSDKQATYVQRHQYHGYRFGYYNGYLDSVFTRVTGEQRGFYQEIIKEINRLRKQLEAQNV